MPALFRALVIGGFGGIGLVLTQIYSRRGPLIFPVYAALRAGTRPYGLFLFSRSFS